ncbi:MAG: hypothetical protein ABIH70_09275 [Chloroflexota bacterium]
MCRLCGCREYIEQGTEVIRQRAAELTRNLQLTPQNVDDYEILEQLATLIAPFGARDDEIFQVATRVSRLHDDIGGREERYQALVRAFKSALEHLPVHGDPKEVVTAYHQLEQLSKELDEAGLADVAPEIRETILTVKNVHEGIEAKIARWRKQYGL